MSKKLAIEILNQHPLATEAVKDWFLKKMIVSFEEDDAPEDFKEQMLKIGIPDNTLAIMLDSGPRNFFDVFDDNRIFIEIRLCGTAEGGFYYIINGVEDNLIYDNRIPCERAAVVKALELFN